jgi:hypothetical protein
MGAWYGGMMDGSCWNDKLLIQRVKVEHKQVSIVEQLALNTMQVDRKIGQMSCLFEPCVKVP